jgi:hypothetical protein
MRLQQQFRRRLSKLCHELFFDSKSALIYSSSQPFPFNGMELGQGSTRFIGRLAIDFRNGAIMEICQNFQEIVQTKMKLLMVDATLKTPPNGGETKVGTSEWQVGCANGQQIVHRLRLKLKA